AQRRGECPAGHLRRFLSIPKDPSAGPGHAALFDLKAAQVVLDPVFLLIEKGLPSDELSFIKFNDPTQTRLEGRVLLIELVAVKRIAHLGPKCVASAQACGQHALLFGDFEKPVPYNKEVAGRREELK